MSYEMPCASALDYAQCNYGASRLPLRGPRRALDRPYVAILGGSHTFGRYVAHPFPDLVETALGRDCVNLGCMNGGLDAFAHDPVMLDIASRADAVVLQVMGAHNLTNRYYRVHPRRNDRFVAETPHLTRLYPEVDFTKFHFTRHLLAALRGQADARFEMVRDELRQVWAVGMRAILSKIDGRKLILWLRPEDDGARTESPDELQLITPDMVLGLKQDVDAIAEIATQPAGECDDIAGMVLGSADVAPAARHLGPGMHRHIANHVADTLRPLLET